MKVRFFLSNGVMVEWPIPAGEEPNFSFHGMVNTIRATGFFMLQDVYIVDRDISMIAIEGANQQSAAKIVHSPPAGRQ
jgi:hypothetical protein